MEKEQKYSSVDENIKKLEKFQSINNFTIDYLTILVQILKNKNIILNCH